MSLLQLIESDHLSLQSTVPRTRNIDRFSRLRNYSTGVLANQNASTHLRQSGRLSGHHT